jgi:hypothetical protein
MVAICERYSKAWSFSFSPAKSKLLQFVKHSIGRNVILYNEPITEVSSAKHVGIVLDTSLKTMERECFTNCNNLLFAGENEKLHALL